MFAVALCTVHPPYNQLYFEIESRNGYIFSLHKICEPNKFFINGQNSEHMSNPCKLQMYVNFTFILILENKLRITSRENLM